MGLGCRDALQQSKQSQHTFLNPNHPKPAEVIEVTARLSGRACLGHRRPSLGASCRAGHQIVLDYGLVLFNARQGRPQRQSLPFKPGIKRTPRAWSLGKE